MYYFIYILLYIKTAREYNYRVEYLQTKLKSSNRNCAPSNIQLKPFN